MNTDTDSNKEDRSESSSISLFELNTGVILEDFFPPPPSKRTELSKAGILYTGEHFQKLSRLRNILNRFKLFFVVEFCCILKKKKTGTISLQIFIF